MEDGAAAWNALPLDAKMAPHLHAPTCTLPLRLLQKHNHNQNLLYLIGTVFPPQLLAAITAVVGDEVVDVHVLGVEENKLAVAIDHLAQLGDQRMV